MHSTPWMTVVEHRIKGHTEPFTFVTRSDFVVVICETERGVVLVRQWRHAARSWFWELPQGGKEPGESVTQAATRELHEETGWHAEQPVVLASDLREAGDWATHRFHVVGCRASVRTESARGAEELIDESIELSWPELRVRIANGGFVDAATLAALAIRMATI